jgi:hypothetical protein
MSAPVVGTLRHILADYPADLRVVVEDRHGRQYPLDEPYGYTLDGERVVILPLGDPA